MALILPGYRFKDLGPDGGPFDQSNLPKALVHTTEGSTLAGAESAFRNYPPHLGYDPRYRTKVQYVDLRRHSYSIRNVEAEDDYVIQIEVVGFAAQTHTWPDSYYRNFAEDVIAPLEKAIKVPRRHLRFYGADEGIVLASRHSPIRLSNAAWRAYSGWLGHQHSPDPDEHWDPGRFLMDKAFSYLTEDDMTPEESRKLTELWDALLPGQADRKSSGVMANYIRRGMLAAEGIAGKLSASEARVMAAIKADASELDIDEVAEALREKLGDELAEAIGQRLLSGKSQ